MSPEDVFKVKEKVLPRRKSVRRIFEPLHRTEEDLRSRSVVTDKSQAWTKVPVDNKNRLPSAQAMKSKRFCKVGVIDCKKASNSAVGSKRSTARSKSLATRASTARPSTSKQKRSSSSSHTVKPSRSASRHDGKVKTGAVVIETGGGNSDESANASSNNTAAALLSKLEQMRAKLNERIADDFRRRMSENQENLSALNNMEEQIPSDQLLDQNFNPQEFLPNHMPVQVVPQQQQGGNEDSASLVPSTSSKKKRGKVKTGSAVPNEREKEFRALYDRIRAHYLIQEETCRNMAPRDKLEKTIKNAVHFEKELLEYLALPDADPQAKLVLKELRSRRADMVTKLRTLDGGPVDSKPTTRGSSSKVRSALSPRLPVYTSAGRRLRAKGSKTAEISRRQSTNRSKKDLSMNKSIIPPSLRPKGSKRFSRKSLFKMLDKMEEEKARSGNEFPGWRKSDFVKLLPHSGEIPKYVSKVEAAEDSSSKWKPKPRDPRTYMLWLEELMTQRLREKARPSQSKYEPMPYTPAPPPPKWTVVAAKKQQDPFALFRRPHEDKQFAKNTPLLSRPQPSDSRRVESKGPSRTGRDPSVEQSKAPWKNNPRDSTAAMQVIERAVRDVVAHQSKYMEEASSARQRNNHPLRLSRLTENSYPRQSNPQHPDNNPISTIMRPKTVEQPPSQVMYGTNSDMRPPSGSQVPVSTRPTGPLIDNPMMAAKINREFLTSTSGPRVLLPVISKIDKLNSGLRDLQRKHTGPSNIYSTTPQKSILKPMIPMTTTLKIRPTKPAPRMATTNPGGGLLQPLPNYAQPRFLDQFLNRQETQRLFASGAPEGKNVIATSVF